jgi:hypothetical protein
MAGPLGGAGAGDPEASTINVKNIDGGPLGGPCRGGLVPIRDLRGVL